MKMALWLLFCLRPVQDPSLESIQALIQELGSEDIAARSRASEGLRKCGAEAEALLRRASESESPEIRVRALELLRQLEADRLWTPELRGNEHLHDLPERLLSPDPSVRLKLTRALESCQLRSAVPILKRLLRDSNADVRAAACASIGYYGDKGAAPLIGALLKDPSPSVRISAIQVVASFRDRNYSELVLAALEDVDPDIRGAAASAAGAMTPQRGDRLSRMLKDPEPAVKRGALSGIAASGDPGFAPMVLELVNHPSGNLRMDARILLRRWNVPIPEQEIPAALDRDSVLDCESALLDAVPAVTSEALRDRLLAFAADGARHPVTRRAAARLLRRSGHSTLPEILKEQIRSQDEITRCTAIRVAAEFTDPSLNELLVNLPSEKLSPEAMIVLCEGLSLLPVHPTATELLLRLCRHPRPEISIAALSALDRHRDPRAAEIAWAELFRDGRTPKRNGEKLIEQVLCSDRPELRLTLMRSMGDSGGAFGPDIVDVLIRKPRTLEGEEIDILLKCVRTLHFRPVEALVCCSARAAAPSLASLLGGTTNRGRSLLLDALRRLGSAEQVPAVLSCLDSSDPDVVAAALLALSEIGGKPHVPWVVKFLSDQRLILGPRRFSSPAEDPGPTVVLEAATKALEKIVGVRFNGLNALETAQEWVVWWEDNKSRF